MSKEDWFKEHIGFGTQEVFSISKGSIYFGHSGSLLKDPFLRIVPPKQRFLNKSNLSLVKSLMRDEKSFRGSFFTIETFVNVYPAYDGRSPSYSDLRNKDNRFLRFYCPLCKATTAVEKTYPVKLVDNILSQKYRLSTWDDPVVCGMCDLVYLFNPNSFGRPMPSKYTGPSTEWDRYVFHTEHKVRLSPSGKFITSRLGQK